MQASTINTARGRNPLKASQAVRSEFRRRGKRPGNLTFFYGPKVDRDWVLRSSLELAAALDAEASQDITWYSCDPDSIWSELSAAGYKGAKPDMIQQQRAGSRAVLEVSYKHGAPDERAQRHRVQESHASALGYAWSSYGEEDALRKQVMLMNWLAINPVLQQFRCLDVGALQTEIAGLINARQGATVAEVYAAFKLQRPHVFVALMRAHQRRLLTVEISQRPFGLATTVSPWSSL
jgi:hypothetical protein